MIRVVCAVLFVLTVETALYMTHQYANASSLRVPVLSYHYIGYNPDPNDIHRDPLSVHPDLFDQQMGYLQQQGFTPITFNQLYAIFNHVENAPPKPIIITIDDGYIDFFTTAFPILQKYHFHAVSFIPTGLIGKGAYMSWDEIKQLQRSGLIEFEAHTVTHVNLAIISLTQAKQEIADSKEILQSQIGQPVNFFAYPYGVYNANIMAAVKQAGYVGAVTTKPGRATGPGFLMPRINIPGGTTLAQFMKKVN